jgi:uncharacterized membrane protein
MSQSQQVREHLTAAERAATEARRMRERLHHHAHQTAGPAGRPTFGQRAADGAARVIGSWRFLIVQTVVLAGWVTLNVLAWVRHWDPYPFILLNLALSFQAAYSAPVLLMSSNRQGAVDREAAERDRLVNSRAEAEVGQLVSLMNAQLQQGAEILELLRARPVAADG